MKRDGLDAPDARPLDAALLFLRETFAGIAGFAIHLREDRGIEVALVEGDFAAANDSGDDSGESLDASHRANRVRVLAGNPANFEGEFRSGRQRVAACTHRSRAGVRFLSMESDCVTLDAFCAKDRG